MPVPGRRWKHSERPDWRILQIQTLRRSRRLIPLVFPCAASDAGRFCCCPITGDELIEINATFGLSGGPQDHWETLAEQRRHDRPPASNNNEGRPQRRRRERPHAGLLCSAGDHTTTSRLAARHLSGPQSYVPDFIDGAGDRFTLGPSCKPGNSSTFLPFAGWRDIFVLILRCLQCQTTECCTAQKQDHQLCGS